MKGIISPVFTGIGSLIAVHVNTEMMTVRPRDGLRIADPDRHDFIEQTGRVVPQSVYWMRRLADGDVTIIEPVIGDRPNAVAQAHDESDAAVIPASPKKRTKIDGGADTQ